MKITQDTVFNKTLPLSDADTLTPAALGLDELGELPAGVAEALTTLTRAGKAGELELIGAVMKSTGTTETAERITQEKRVAIVGAASPGTVGMLCVTLLRELAAKRFPAMQGIADALQRILEREGDMGSPELSGTTPTATRTPTATPTPEPDSGDGDGVGDEVQGITDAFLDLMGERGLAVIGAVGRPDRAGDGYVGTVFSGNATVEDTRHLMNQLNLSLTRDVLGLDIDALMGAAGPGGGQLTTTTTDGLDVHILRLDTDTDPDGGGSGNPSA